MFGSGIAPDKHSLILGAALLAGMLWVAVRDYLIFHTLIGIVTVVVVWSIFVTAWNSRRIVRNAYFSFIGIAYLFAGLLELLHILSYKGMAIFGNADQSAQLGIIARSLESAALVIAPLLQRKRLKTGLVFIVFGAVAAGSLLSVFYWRNFPVCFIDGIGPTGFEKISEYVIILLFIASIFTLSLKRRQFELNAFRALAASLTLSTISELAFTANTSFLLPTNEFGHFLRLIAVYLMYRVFIRTGIFAPFNRISRNLTLSEKNLYSLLEGLPAFVFVQMPDYTIRYANRVSHDGVFDLRSMALHRRAVVPYVGVQGHALGQPRHVREMVAQLFRQGFQNTHALVIHGEQDYRVPLDQGLQLFTALQLQKVPSKLLEFPDEGHWVSGPPKRAVVSHRAQLDRPVGEQIAARLLTVSALALVLASCASSPEARLRHTLATQTTGAIVLPAGTVQVSSELTLAPGAHDLEISGAPSGSILRAGPSFQGRALLVLDGAHNIRIRDLTIEGNRERAQRALEMAPPENYFRMWYPDNGILADRVDGLEIRNVHLDHIINFPILVSRSKNIRIVKADIRDSGSRNAMGRNNLSGGILIEEGSSHFEVRDSDFKTSRATRCGPTLSGSHHG